MTERLDKFLSHSGFGSRRDIKKLANQKLITVDGEVVRDVTFKVDAEKCDVCVDGKKVCAQKFLYLMMNKPTACVSVKKEGEHTTVFELLPAKYRTPFFENHLHCVGRLDVDTEGFLILTTDGSFTHKITAPKSHLAKKYFVRLQHAVSIDEQNEISKKFTDGIFIEREGKEPSAICKSATVEWCNCDGANRCATECFLTITEGKYHQVKRMFGAVENEVVYLKRVAIGSVCLDDNVKAGDFREMTEIEVSRLKKEIGLE